MRIIVVVWMACGSGYACLLTTHRHADIFYTRVHGCLSGITVVGTGYGTEVIILQPFNVHQDGA